MPGYDEIRERVHETIETLQRGLESTSNLQARLNYAELVVTTFIPMPEEPEPDYEEIDAETFDFDMWNEDR